MAFIYKSFFDGLMCPDDHSVWTVIIFKWSRKCDNVQGLDSLIFVAILQHERN